MTANVATPKPARVTESRDGGWTQIAPSWDSGDRVAVAAAERLDGRVSLQVKDARYRETAVTFLTLEESAALRKALLRAERAAKKAAKGAGA